MPEDRETQALQRLEELFAHWHIDTAQRIEVGGLKADLVAYGYHKAVVVLIRLGNQESNVSFNAVSEAIILREHTGDALDRETIALLLTDARVPDTVRDALRDWRVSIIRMAEGEEVWLRRVSQELREWGVVL